MVRVNELVVEEVELSYSGPVDVKELDAFLRASLKKRGFRVNVKRHDVKTSGGKRSIKNKFEASKVIDDYHKFEITYQFAMKSYKAVKVEGKKLADGDMVFKIEAELLRDYEKEWSKGGPLRTFFRGVYDKFIATRKESDIAETLIADVDAVIDDLKTYLGIGH